MARDLFHDWIFFGFSFWFSYKFFQRVIERYGSHSPHQFVEATPDKKKKLNPDDD